MDSGNTDTLNSRDLQKQATYERLYSATLKEFARVGVEQTKIEKICRQVGVAKGTFFFHFPTKDHVLLARQRQISLAMAERIRQELKSTRSIRSFLKRLADIIIEEHQAVGDIELVRQINLAIVRHSGSRELGIESTAFGQALQQQLLRLQQGAYITSSQDVNELADCLRLSLFGFLVDPQRSFQQIRPKMNLMLSLLAESLHADQAVSRR